VVENPQEPVEAEAEAKAESKAEKDLLARLAEAGEEALQRLSEAPGFDRAIAAARSTRRQLDELTRRVQGISDLEERIGRLEKQVAALTKSQPAKRVPARKSTP
jgi:hypothetical protein